MSSRIGMIHINGNRRPNTLNRMNSIERTNLPHDYIIKYIYDSWNTVTQEVDRNSGSSVMYYKEENFNLKDFQPFDLDTYRGIGRAHV